MNRHPGPFPLALLAVALIVSLTSSHLLGQVPAPATPAAPAPAAPAPAAPAAPAATGPLTAAGIAAQVKALTSGTPQAAAAARDALIDGAGPGAAATALATYAGQLNAAIAPALNDPNELVRLNAGIVVARVAERSGTGGLSAAALTLLNDKSRGVVLWGVKSARWIIPALLRAPPAGTADPLMAAVVKAVATHGQGAIGGPIVIEAYEALMVDAFNTNAKVRPTPVMIRAVIPFMHQLLQQRVAAYQKGIPPEPAADSRGTLFLVDATVWGLHTPPQRVASIQAMSDVVGLAAQHAQTASANDLADLGYMIGLVSKAIAVVPQNASIQGQLGLAMKIDQRSNATQIQAAVEPVVPALKTVKEFAGITPPPTATPAPAPANDNGGGAAPNGSTTAPSTAPAAATGPATTASTTR